MWGNCRLLKVLISSINERLLNKSNDYINSDKVFEQLKKIKSIKPHHNIV